MKNTALYFNNEKGVVVILVAILIPVFLGVVAFAIDIGYTRIVRNQLQNAADATALAACNHFYDRTVPNFNDPDDLIPKWNDAVTESASAITDNTADNKQLETCTTAVGWWDFTQAYPAGSMWPNPLSTPPPNTPPTADYGPAAMVTVTKTSGQNSGPVSSFFGRIFGFTSYDNGATATAIAASPGSVRPEAIVPFAIAKCVLDANNYADFDDEDELIALGSDYHYPDSQAGQWTTFFLDTNNTPDVAGLIDSGNPTYLSIGDEIWIAPGTKDTLYDQYPKGNLDEWYGGENIAFPIVDCPIDIHAKTPIRGFIGFHIVCAGKACKNMTFDYYGDTITVGNNEKIVVGYFTTAPAYGGTLGPHYGPLDRCRLCK